MQEENNRFFYKMIRPFPASCCSFLNSIVFQGNTIKFVTRQYSHFLLLLIFTERPKAFIMKISLAQIQPFAGDIPRNVQLHRQAITLAVAQQAEMIIFPELSITGYEPTLAQQLASTPDEESWKIFQQLSDESTIVIGISLPLQTGNDINIGMLIFQPGEPVQVYTKQHLHEDELPFFVSGLPQNIRLNTAPDIAFAICYEISVPSHSANAAANGAKIYLASVAKTATGVDKAMETLAGIAGQYGMTVLMVNSTGYCDNFHADGRSAIWKNDGTLAMQLDNTSQGILMIDTVTGETGSYYL